MKIYDELDCSIGSRCASIIRNMFPKMYEEIVKASVKEIKDRLLH